MVLFLDFDGVLHPSEVYLINDEAELRVSDNPGLRLFCWAPILESILDDYDPAGRVKIVLSTTWGHRWGWEVAAARLSVGLSNRVVGGTSPAQISRGLQIKNHVEQMNIHNWLALDDDVWGWPGEYRHRLVLTESDVGLSSLKTQLEFKNKLDNFLK